MSRAYRNHFGPFVFRWKGNFYTRSWPASWKTLVLLFSFNRDDPEGGWLLVFLRAFSSGKVSLEVTRGFFGKLPTHRISGNVLGINPMYLCCGNGFFYAPLDFLFFLTSRDSRILIVTFWNDDAKTAEEVKFSLKFQVECFLGKFPKKNVLSPENWIQSCSKAHMFVIVETLKILVMFEFSLGGYTPEN